MARTPKQHLDHDLQSLRQEFELRLVTYIRNNPSKTLSQIAMEWGLVRAALFKIAKRHGVTRKRGRASSAYRLQVQK